MKKIIFPRTPYNQDYIQNDTPIDCILTFLLIFIPLIIISVFLENDNILFQIFLFLLGWFLWTFLEYMFHRFVSHNKNKKRILLKDTFNHLYQHQHHTKFGLTIIHQFLLLSISVVIILIAIRLNDYFTLFAGFESGFTIYSLMHKILHQKFAQRLLKKQVRYHIYHHCKNPNKCFGISVTWWDDILKTSPPKNDFISQKILDFYFDKKTSSTSVLMNKTVVIFLLIVFVHLNGTAQKKSLKYDVMRNGNTIGYINVTEITEGNTIFLFLKSEVKTRFIFSYSSFVTESVLFENGLMIYSNYYKKENGKETILKKIADGKYFKTISNGQKDSEIFSQIRKNYLQLFFLNPEGVSEIYSNHYQQLLSLEKISDNQYRVQLPDGDHNYFIFKNGICTEVNVPRSFFTIHFILKKIEK